MFDLKDYQYMALAHQMAKKGLYTTQPNPRVGCVIVREDEILSQGWTQPAGKAHAEAHAIYQSDCDLSQSTVYVTLEPCSHQGRTPPCSQALISAMVKRVVVAATDSNPRVSGQGIADLKDAGITVHTGLLESDTRELNKGFFNLHEKARPWIRLKSAASLDGKTAMANGQSQWITSEPARLDGHRFRAQSAAVLTGINTVLADDPSLTARVEGVIRQPIRVVLDSTLQLPINAKLFDSEGEVLVFTGVDSNSKQAQLIKNKGANVITLNTRHGRVDLNAVIETLAAMSINEVHVEAGKLLTGEFIRQKLADELLIYLAPLLLGDSAAGMFHIEGLDNLKQQHKLRCYDQRMVGLDMRMIMRFKD